MPNTLIREGYLDSDRVSALSDFDDRVFFRVLLAADDAGRTDGRVDKLRSALFPTREAVRSVDIEKSTSRLIAAGLLTRWEWEGKPVIQVMRWQRRSGAIYSKFPDVAGSFKIQWVEVETRDGKQSFSSRSLLKGSAPVPEPIDNPSVGGIGISPETDTETKSHTETETATPLPPGTPSAEPGGADSTVGVSSEDRAAARAAFDRWAKRDHGGGIDVMRNEHVPIHALLDRLAQEPKPLHRLVPEAVSDLMNKGSPVFGKRKLAYVCSAVESHLTENGGVMPERRRGTSGPAALPRNSAMDKPFVRD